MMEEACQMLLTGCRKHIKPNDKIFFSNSLNRNLALCNKAWFRCNNYNPDKV